MSEIRKKPQSDYVGIVRGALSSLPYRDWTIINVSIALNTSTRTLQRVLKAHGTSFRAVVREEQLAEVKRLLGDGRTGKEISDELGFAQYSACYRFIRRTAGCDLRALRSSILSPILENQGPSGRSTEDQPASE